MYNGILIFFESVFINLVQQVYLGSMLKNICWKLIIYSECLIWITVGQHENYDRECKHKRITYKSI